MWEVYTLLLLGHLKQPCPTCLTSGWQSRAERTNKVSHLHSAHQEGHADSPTSASVVQLS